MNKVNNFDTWKSVTESMSSTSPKRTISFSGGYMVLTKNKMVNNLKGFEQAVIDGHEEQAEMYVVIGFNEVEMDGTNYVLSAENASSGFASEEGRGIIAMSTDKNHIESIYKKGNTEGYASIAMGPVEWSKMVNSAITVRPTDISIKTI
mgnify:FL=1|tara:strand:+ start:3414 stop:3860 length:447 start_codon:yes stop_codon:yes gene_type:complete